MNFSPTTFAGRRYAIHGLGKMGRAAARALLAMGADVTAWDDSLAARKAALDLRLVQPKLKGLSGLVLAPGIPHLLPEPHPIAVAARKAGVPIVSDVDLLFEAVRANGSMARFAGITGTNGKSTTTALLAHILATAGRAAPAGGNLGTPALALPLLQGEGTYVLEMSSYMLERVTQVHFSAACLLNIAPDHIDRHGDIAGYIAAKRRIFDRQSRSDLAVIGIDDPDAAQLARMMNAVTISGEKPADFWGDGAVLRSNTGDLADLSRARALPGEHNAQNAAAAAAMALYLGADLDAVARGIATYPGLPHRMEFVGAARGISFVNDSKATNADSTARALACYDRVILIAGGTAKEGGIESLTSFFPRIARAYLIGRDAPILGKTLAEHGVAHEHVGTLENAVAAAWTAAQTGAAPVILLSPACASWDQFTGFDARGDLFRSLAQVLISGETAA